MLRRPLPWAVLWAAVGVAGVPGRGPADPPAAPDPVARVNRAIDRGVAYLKTSHSPQTQWEGLTLALFAGQKGGATALATLALLTCGVPPTDPVVDSALRYLRTVDPDKTYVVGLQTMAFAEAGLAADRPRIQRNVDWLLDTAVRRGGGLTGWSYPFDAGGRPDGSNTQYALLGLYAGKQAGAKIPPAVWDQVRRLYLTTQAADGGWAYEGGSGTSFTMTSAGVCGLLIARMGRDDSPQGLDPATGVAAACGRYPDADALGRGLGYIADHFSYADPVGAKSNYYSLYGVERVGRLSGQRFLGRVDWYREGCDHLVARQNPADGSWPGPGEPARLADGLKPVATSFALLFLGRGRAPVVVSKLAHGPARFDGRQLVELGGPAGAAGWNRKHHDARNLAAFASRELFAGRPLGWQAYDPRRRDLTRDADLLAEVGALVTSPVLYLTGHDAPRLAGRHKELVKRYVEEGGFVLAEACCGSPAFADGFRDLMRELFPDNRLRPVGPDHPVWRSYFAVPPTAFPKLEGLDRGCRTVVLFSPEPLAGYWEEERFMPAGRGPAADRGQQAFRLGGNVIAYATGLEPPKQRGAVARIADPAAERPPPRGFVKPAQLRLPGEPEPAPAALRRLMTHLRDAARLDVTLDKESLPATHDDLFQYKFLYLHGRRRFALPPEGVDNLRANLATGGLLLADACCGRPEFDAAFRDLARTLFPDRPLEVVPADDPLYSADLNGGEAVRTVKRREAADAGFDDRPPLLEGVRVDGRWVVLYSKYDIGCALEGHKATDCLGHTPDSALKLATAAVLYALRR